MFNLVFLFTGLCVFALDAPPPYTPQQLTVVLPDASMPHGTSHHVRHASVLVVYDDSSILTSKPTKLFSTQYDGQHVGYLLDGLLVRIQGAAASAINVVRKDTDPACPKAGDVESFSWVMPMGRMADKYVNLPVNPAERMAVLSDIAAKLEFHGGSLRTQSLARYADPLDDKKEKGVVLWRVGGSYRALADSVEWKQERSPGAVTIEFVDLQTNQLKDKMVLKGSAATTAYLEIKNMPEDQICCSNLPPGVPANSTLYHFEHLYHLREQDHGPTPFAIGSCSEDPVEPTLNALLCARECPHAVVEAAKAVGNPQCPGGDQSGP